MSKTVASVPSFVEAVIETRDRWFPTDPYPEVWFRGIDDGNLALLPGAYWRANCDETSLALSFRNLVPAYVGREPLDDWEWYYLMQHYGLPTRLLDWTESALIGLYFALAEEKPSAPCVWLMDPVALNVGAHGSHEEAIVVPSAQDTVIAQWLPGKCGRGIPLCVYPPGTRFADNSKPLAIFPKRNNPRIVAQRGTFTIHGSREEPIDWFFRTSTPSGVEVKVTKILIDPTAVARIRSDLHTLGVTKSALFPEPQSVADDLKRQYGVS